MFETVISGLLQRVERPSRYLGCEVNALVRPPKPGELKICVAYPGLYEEGIFSPALTAIYGLLAGRKGFHVERAFRPAPDMEAELARLGVPWFSQETWRPLASFDLVVVVVPWPEAVAEELAFLGSGYVLKTKALRWPAWKDNQCGRAEAFFLGDAGESLRGLLRGTDLLRPGSVPMAEDLEAPVRAGPSRWLVPFASARGGPSIECPPGLLSSLPELLEAAAGSTGLERIEARLKELPPGWEPPPALEALLRERGVKAELVLSRGEGGTGRPLMTLPRGPRPAVEARSRCRLRLERKGTGRWLSHLEHVQAVRRAFRRAGIALATDAGRSPKARLAFGPAVSVGQESESEYVDAWLAGDLAPEEAARSLARALPAGYRVLEAKKVPLHFPSVEASSNAALWEASGDLPDDLDERLKQFESREELWMEKRSPSRTSKIDLRKAAEFRREATTLRLRLRFPPGLPLRPEEALKALGLAPAERRGEGKGKAGGTVTATGTASGATASGTASAKAKGTATGAAKSTATGTARGREDATSAPAITLVRKELFTVTESGETLSP